MSNSPILKQQQLGEKEEGIRHHGEKKRGHDSAANQWAST